MLWLDRGLRTPVPLRPGFFLLTNYHTLKALVREWQCRLQGAVVLGAFSQMRGECTLLFDTQSNSSESIWSLKISLQAPLRYLFMNPGASRAKKNVAELFRRCRGVHVDAISMADGDRLIDIGFSDVIML